MNYREKALKKGLQKVEKELFSDPEKEARKAKAKKDFQFFIEYYIAPHIDEYVPPAEYQKRLLRILAERKFTEKDAEWFRNFVWPQRREFIRPCSDVRGILDLEPRDHGKTTRMTQLFPLWLALTHERVFVVLILASKDQAQSVLESIKLELETNEKILEDFGEQKTNTWSKKKIVLSNGNAIAALGAGQTIRGIKHRYLRPTHIICDDLLKDEEVESASKREFLYRWFKRVVFNLGKDALVAVVNTIMHPDDLPSRLKEEIKEGRLKDWICIWLAARDVYGRPIWPQRWSDEELKHKEEKLGPEIWATEMNNDPLPESSKKFRSEWFVYYDITDIDLRDLRVVCAVDPATGAEAGDYTAVVTIGAPKSGYPIYVLDAWGERCSDIELIKKLVEVYKTFKPQVILFEEQNFQKIYKNLCMREAYQQYKVRLPVKGVKQNIKKALRISSLSPLVEAGILRFRKNQKLLLEQLEYFPKGHDDLPDALEMAVSALESAEKKPFAHTRNVRRKSREVINKMRRFYGG